jgi:hypothetical protein
VLARQLGLSNFIDKNWNAPTIYCAQLQLGRDTGGF